MYVHVDGLTGWMDVCLCVDTLTHTYSPPPKKLHTHVHSIAAGMQVRSPLLNLQGHPQADSIQRARYVRVASCSHTSVLALGHTWVRIYIPTNINTYVHTHAHTHVHPGRSTWAAPSCGSRTTCCTRC